MKKLEYTFKTDTLFKMLFVEHPDLLQKLVAVLLSIPEETITEFVVRNPEMPPELVSEKFCRLDINMLVNAQRVDLEIQVCNRGDYIERVLFYWAREFSTALPKGGSYTDLPRTLILSILDFPLFDCGEYHSFFQPLEVNRHTLLSDKMGFHFFELPKLPEEVDGKDALLLWLSLFRADTEEELETIKALEVPEMEQAINAYYKITASPEFRELERMRERARLDEISARRYERQEGRAEGRAEGRVEGCAEAIRSLMESMGLSLEQAMRALKVPEQEQANYRKLLQS